MSAPSRLFLILLIGLPACQIAGPDDPRTREYDTHREQWDANNDGTYSFLMFRGCFCAWGGSLWIQVIDDEVTLAFRTETNEPVPDEHLDELETIDEIFDMIERAEREADQLDVTWSDEGYPSEVSIDWIRNAVDDEMMIRISGVTPGVHPVD